MLNMMRIVGDASVLCVGVALALRCPRQHQSRHMGCSCTAQGSGRCMHRGSGGDDVVDQHDALPLERACNIGCYPKALVRLLPALRAICPDLVGLMRQTLQGGRVEMTRRQMPSQLQRLVETSLLQSIGCKRHGNDAIGLFQLGFGPRRVTHQARKDGCKADIVAKFQSGDALRPRKVIVHCSDASCERVRMRVAVVAKGLRWSRQT